MNLKSKKIKINNYEKNVSIFISDEGYGHTIRQRTIIKELLKSKKFGKIVFHEKIKDYQRDSQ